MADLSITAAQVKLVSGPKASGTSGATLTGGMGVYLDSYTKKLLGAIATSAAAAAAVGVLLTAAASDGQEADYALPGAVVDMGAGAAPAAGKIWIVGASAGAWSPHTDATTPNTGEFCTVGILGIGNNRVLVICVASGVAAA